MYKGKREDELLLHLTEVEYATIDSLAEKMQISPSSIRRDLKDLEKRGLVKRSYGGVKITDAARATLPTGAGCKEEGASLPRLAELACSFLIPDTTVFLDASLPSLALSRLLPTDLGLSVMTSSPELAVLLTGRGIPTFCTGGACRMGHPTALVGEGALDRIRSMHADIAFLSPDTVTHDGLLLDRKEDTAAVHRLMSKQAKRTVILIEGGHWDTGGTFSFGSAGTVERIITDRVPDEHTIPSEKLLFPISEEE